MPGSPESSSSRHWTLVAAILGSAVVFLDSTIVNVALERIGEQLPSHLFGRLEGQSYVYNGYLLSLSALIILAGALTDYYGRKRMFIIGLAGFGLTSALCGLAPNLELLVLFRIVQGAAGALLVPGSMALINTHFDEAERPRAYGIWAAASSATTTLGSPIGGVLVDTLSWRSAFLINLPIAAVALVLTARHVTETRDERASGHFDWLGAGVVALGVGGLAFGGIRGQETNWRAGSAFLALAIGVVACLAFVPIMRRSRNPLVPMDLFRSRPFVIINVSTLVVYGALYVSYYVQALFYQGVLGYSALAAGLASLPSGVMIATLSTAAGSLSARLGARRFLILGPSIMGCGLLWLSRIPVDSAAWVARPDVPASLIPPASYFIDVLPAALAFGGGAALMVAPLTSVLMSSVSDEHSGLASAINNAISRIGPQLAGAVVFIAVTASFYSALAHQLPAGRASSPELRSAVAPLNAPAAGTPRDVATASSVASTSAFSLANRLAAALLFSGAAINGLGLKPRPAA